MRIGREEPLTLPALGGADSKYFKDFMINECYGMLRLPWKVKVVGQLPLPSCLFPKIYSLLSHMVWFHLVVLPLPVKWK